MQVVQDRWWGLDGEIATDAAGRDGSCLAAVAAAEWIRHRWRDRDNHKRTRGGGRISDLCLYMIDLE
jgi:hypothetical protein